jgi:hypothetical protein
MICPADTRPGSPEEGEPERNAMQVRSALFCSVLFWSLVWLLGSMVGVQGFAVSPTGSLLTSNVTVVGIW